MSKRRAQPRAPRFGDRNFEAAPKLVAPADGVATAFAIGSSWWAKQWIAALEHLLGGDAGRLARGRTYARGGRVSQITIDGSKVMARVTGSRIYQVALTVGALNDAAWATAVTAMASQASFAAALLNGTMPQHIDDVFRTTGATLFPTTRAELRTTCTCPDWGDPCKHVAAVHYVLGDTLDHDPYLLFELRGRTKAQLLAALRLAREACVEGRAELPADKPRKKIGQTSYRPKTGLKTSVVAATATHDYDQMRTPVPDLQFDYTAPTAAVATLQQLGVPTGWTDARSPAELLGPIVAATAAFAQRVATADPETAALLAESPDGVATRKSSRRPKR